MLKMHLFHGRNAPDEEMDDWGFSGPTLTGIESVNWTYGELRLEFATPDAARIAHGLTGWKGFTGPNSTELIVSIVEDMVVTRERFLADEEPEGVEKFYGDWHLTAEGA